MPIDYGSIGAFEQIKAGLQDSIEYSQRLYPRLNIFIAASNKEFALKWKEILKEKLFSCKIISTWTNVDELSDKEKEEKSLNYVIDIERSNIFILQSDINEISENHVKMGIAVSRGIPIFVIGEKRNIFHWFSTVTMCNNIEEVIEKLKEK